MGAGKGEGHDGVGEERVIMGLCVIKCVKLLKIVKHYRIFKKPLALMSKAHIPGHLALGGKPTPGGDSVRAHRRFPCMTQPYQVHRLQTLRWC